MLIALSLRPVARALFWQVCKVDRGAGTLFSVSLFVCVGCNDAASSEKTGLISSPPGPTVMVPSTDINKDG